MNRDQKAQVKEAIGENLTKIDSVIFAEYRGLTVEELTELRVKLREAKAEFHVVKNRLAKKAITDHAPDMEVVAEELKGPIGVVYSFGDSAQTAKTVLEFEKNHPKLVVKAGYMDKSKLSSANLKEIADLPSKEELMAKIVGSIVSPHRNLVGVLSGVNRQLVQVIGAIKDTKSE